MMILKFGGASVATPKSFHQIASIIAGRKKREKGPLIAVLSAMQNTTDQLLALAREVHPHPPGREQDMLVSVGERVSIALLAMALSLQGVEAVSFTGSQSGIVTDERHTEARIVDVRPHRLQRALGEDQVAIVAGFQGVSRRGEITTLGRGGTDTSAVALAIALAAEGVDFYKDVDGIYEEDPKINPSAKKISKMSFESARRLTEAGAKVLHSRSIVLAERNGIQLRIRSFHQPEEVGTFVGEVRDMSWPIRFEQEDL
jgi:aspartate kinase